MIVWIAAGAFLLLVVIVLVVMFSTNGSAGGSGAAAVPAGTPQVDPTVATTAPVGSPVVSPATPVTVTPTAPAPVPVATAPAAPVGSRFVGVYNPPKPVAGGHLALGHMFGKVNCATDAACAQACMDKVKVYYPNGKFAITSTKECRGGGGDKPFDNNGTATWGSGNAWALYSFA